MSSPGASSSKTTAGDKTKPTDDRFAIRISDTETGEDDDDLTKDEEEDEEEEDNDDESDTEPQIQPLSAEALAEFEAKQARTGIVYISRIPPAMRPSKVRHLMSGFGDIGRVYLQQEGESNFLHATTWPLFVV